MATVVRIRCLPLFAFSIGCSLSTNEFRLHRRSNTMTVARRRVSVKGEEVLGRMSVP